MKSHTVRDFNLDSSTLTADTVRQLSFEAGTREKLADSSQLLHELLDGARHMELALRALRNSRTIVRAFA